MKYCTEFAELISPYADGELSDFDRDRVKGHLDTCESCSALLELYREISAATDESCVPAPEALGIGVMGKVLSDSKVSAPVNIRKHKPAHVMMLRYIPAVACLALILLALPWITDTLRRSTYDSGQSAPAAKMSMDKSLNLSTTDTDGANIVMESAMAETESGDVNGDISSGYNAFDKLPATEAPPPQAAPAPDQRNFGADNGSFDNNTDNITGNDPSNKTTNDIKSDVAAVYPPVPMETPAPAPEMVYEYDDAPAPDIENSLLPEWSGIAPGGQGQADADQATGGSMDFLSNFNDAYAWIKITGELPELMKTYEPIPLEGQLNWEVYYVIPRASANELIIEAEARNDITITYKKVDGTYAIVLYLPL